MNTNTIHGALHSTSYWGSSLRSNAGAKNPLVDQVAIQAIDLTSNTSACTRQFNATFFPGPQPVAFSAIGGTTGFGFLQALIATKNAVSGYFAASDMHDGAGQTITGADAISRIGQLFGAAAYGWIRIQDIADRGFHALSNLSYLVPYFASIGDMGFALLFFFVGVLGLRSCLETRSFIMELDKAINELHSGNFEDLQTLIGKMTGEGLLPTGKTISERDLYIHLGQQLRALLDEMDPELVAKSWDSDLGKSLFTEERKKLLPAVLSRLGITTTDDTTLESLQNNPAVIRKVWAKEQKVIYERILGAKGSKLIERAKRMHVYELIANPDTKEYGVKVSTKLLGKLRTCAKDERHRMIAYTISGFAGAVFTILAYAASPAHAFVWSMGILISYGVIAYADFLGLKKAWASEGPIGNSKHYIILHLLVGIAIAATIAATGITGGIFPVAVVALIGLVWLFMDIYALYKAYEKEKAYNAEHPTLEMFLERIKKDGSLNTALDELDKDHTLKMFHKLPKVQREAILRDLQEMMESVDPEFIPGLHTLKLSEDMSEVETGKCLYKELSAQNKALAKRALKQANKVLLSGSEKLKKSNLETHENSDLFYKAFYEEFVKREQRNLLRRAGSTRLRHSVEKVSRDRIEALAHFQKNLSS